MTVAIGDSTVRLALACALAVLLSCSHRAVVSGADGGSVGGDLTLDRSPADTADDADAGGCTPGPRMVYVLDHDRKLYSFDPSQPTSASAFTLRGTLSCPLPGLPHSMAVRQDGRAYVLYVTSDGPGPWSCAGLARVEIDSLSCEAVPAFACGSGGFDTFGMGYALAGPSGEETLYIGNADHPLLGSLDPEVGKVAPIGPLPSEAPELTGNSKGELWGFFPRTVPTRVHRLDPTSGKSLVAFTLSPFTQAWAGAYAFAAWGGAFYIFYGYSNSSTTNVYQLTADGQLTLLFADTGLTIVGAGVSPCGG